jgi:uncharacterized protein
MTAPVDIVRRFYDALGRGDVPGVLSLLDAQVAWTEAERFPWHCRAWVRSNARFLSPRSEDFTLKRRVRKPRK